MSRVSTGHLKQRLKAAKGTNCLASPSSLTLCARPTVNCSSPLWVETAFVFDIITATTFSLTWVWMCCGFCRAITSGTMSWWSSGTAARADSRTHTWSTATAALASRGHFNERRPTPRWDKWEAFAEESSLCCVLWFFKMLPFDIY